MMKMDILSIPLNIKPTLSFLNKDNKEER